MEALQLNEHYTYNDYASWETQERYELIDGVPYMMAAPSIIHQRVSGELFGQLWTFLKGKPCQVFSAPFDVRLSYDENDDNCVQPDLLVVCDSAKLSDGKSCKGVPDMVIEILSPSSASYDCIKKMRLYQNAGVKEYWIVDPEIKSIFSCVLDNDQYITTEYSKNDNEKIPVQILPGCEIQMGDLF